MSSGADERALEEYLRGDSELSHAYRSGNWELPPAAIDNAILREARRAVEPRPRAHNPFARHWMVPASLAATVTLAASLVFFMDAEQSSRQADPWRPVEPEAVQEPLPAALGTESEGPDESELVSSDSTAPAAGLQKRERQASESAVEMLEASPRIPTADRDSSTAAPLTRLKSDLRPASATKDLETSGERSDDLGLDTMERPEDWLEWIRGRVRENRLDEVGTHLIAFQRKYPDYPLPPDLLKLSPTTEPATATSQ